MRDSTSILHHLRPMVIRKQSTRSHGNRTKATTNASISCTKREASRSVAMVSMGAFCFGYALSVINGPLQIMAASVGSTSASGASWIVGSTLIGACAGSGLAAGLADAKGRKKSLVIASLPLLLGPMATALAQNYAWMVGGRSVLGIGVGLTSALVPLYVSEISPTKMRGRFGSVNQLAICIGILGALLANAACGIERWRMAVMLGTLPALMLLIGTTMIPESPRWLKSVGREEEAHVSAMRLWGEDAVQELGDAPSKVSTIAKDVSWEVALKNQGSRHALYKGAALFLLQQFAGINAIVYFSTPVFERAGMASAGLASAIVGVINVLGTVVAGKVLDRTGRKPLLMGSFAIMGTAMAIMACGLTWTPLATISGALALTGTLVYVFGFALGAGPIPSLLMPEILPSSIRGKGMSLAMLTHWLSNFAIGQLFLPAVEIYGLSLVYLAFAAVCMFGFFYVEREIQETAGLSLDQVEVGAL